MLTYRQESAIITVITPSTKGSMKLLPPRLLRYLTRNSRPEVRGISGFPAQGCKSMLPDKVGLYVHFPFCPSICKSCVFSVKPHEQQETERYVDKLLKELDFWTPGLMHTESITSLYFGGGSPILSHRMIREVISRVRELGLRGEIGIELKPGQASPENLNFLSAVGITHVDLGLQSFEEKVFSSLGRPSIFPRGDQDLKQLLLAGLECLDVDVAFDIGKFGAQQPISDAKILFEAGVDQVSIYPISSFTDDGNLKGIDARGERRALKRVAAIGESLGYKRTSVWTFNKHPDKRYDTLTREFYVGLGLSASSSLPGVTTINTFNMEAYVSLIDAGQIPAAVEMPLSGKIAMSNYFYWRLQHGNLDPQRFLQLFGMKPEHALKAWYTVMSTTGAMKQEDGIFQLTNIGMDLFHGVDAFVSANFIKPIWRECSKEAFPFQDDQVKF
jgi:menaquinone C8-methyltransferase